MLDQKSRRATPPHQVILAASCVPMMPQCACAVARCFLTTGCVTSELMFPALCVRMQNHPIRDRGARGRERVPLHQFLRMIAGRAVVGDRANGSNDELVANLRRVGVLSS